MRSELFAAGNMEQQSVQPGFSLQNSKMLKVALNGEAFARVGAMIAYQGNVQFAGQGSGGVGKFLKSKLSGEGIPLMKMTGQGEVFLADLASDIYIVDLEGPHDGLSINGTNVLAFEPSLSWDIQRVKGVSGALMSGSGLFNCVFSGQGRLAITCKGTPVVLNVDKPTFADPQAIVCWSQSLQTGYHRADQTGMGMLLGRSSGEAFTMSFQGQGFIVVQPSEEARGVGAGSGGGGIGGLLGG